MNKGGYPKGALGFTIVETLIVLAVSGMLVLSAIVVISGRASKTQFQTGSNDLKQAFQQIMNESASGYFPNVGGFACKSNGSLNIPQLTTGGAQQGTNGDCVFLGKAVQLGATDAADQLIVYAITGYRLQLGTKNEVTSLPQAWPEAVAQGSGINGSLFSSGQSVTVKQPLENGLTPATMTYVSTMGATGTTSGFALLSTFAAYSDGGGDCSGVCSGSQTNALYAIPGTTVNGISGPNFVDKLDGQGQPAGTTSANNYTPVKTITICLDSGSTNQSVVYTLGSGGNPQAVDMQIQSGSCS